MSITIGVSPTFVSYDSHMATPRERPLLIFDGDCGFCRHWIEKWVRWSGQSFEARPYQEVGKDFPEIVPTDFEKAVFLIDRDGHVSRAAEAVFRSLASGQGPRWPFVLYRTLPGFRPLTEVAYGIVARNRKLFSRLTSFFE